MHPTHLLNIKSHRQWYSVNIICTFVTPRAPIHTSRWATLAVTRRLTHRPMWAAQACQLRTAPGRRASWVIWQAAFGVCTTCWRACLRGTSRLPPPQPRAAPSLAQVPLMLCRTAADHENVEGSSNRRIVLITTCKKSPYHFCCKVDLYRSIGWIKNKPK